MDYALRVRFSVVVVRRRKEILRIHAGLRVREVVKAITDNKFMTLPARKRYLHIGTRSSLRCTQITVVGQDGTNICKYE